jgi:hypothetical protein
MTICGEGDMMFMKKRARRELLINMNEELINKIDELIKVEREFINHLNGFMMFEKRMEQERLKYDVLEAQEKNMTKGDMRY